ncbi:MAG: LysR family transcriptional regulator [Planctomycetes bacterium]|nr:LysR family transcriptional regulator [Planctomycetota bacterium]
MDKSRNKRLRLRLKLWLSAEQSDSSFGDGKWQLLEAIEKTESLKSTCEKLGISYRKAWGNLKNAEECLKFPLVTKSRGGKTHGHSNLTEQGKAWVEAYSKFHRDVEDAAETAYSKYLENFELKQ